jgi:CRISPR-associated endonuclease/helicase Cas3
MPTVNDSVPDLNFETVAPYDDHTFLRSWLALRAKPELVLPEDFDPLIAAVYDEDREPPQEHALAARWAVSRTGLAEQQAKEADQARQRLIKRPSTETLAELVERFLEEDNPELHQTFQALTRLAEPSVPIVVAWKRADGAFVDSEGQPVDTCATPTGDNARRLLEQSMSVSRALYWALQGQDPPAPWRRSPYLREHRLIALETDAPTTIGGVGVSYDAEIGLQVNRGVRREQ